ncbi:MAG: sugar ABC transporter ATP-binding protein [Spirochaetaceae bacterium]|jgi:ribose transport system ATP-binding protein|nr:sugar ABC transporter ATP-binding protein [Spirochaetaceae bacterium]
MSDSNLILDLQHITKTYPGVVALNDVSLQIRRGEVHALVGENGAGKSTLIKSFSGAQTPDSGNIIIDGETFSKLTPQLSEEKGVGVIYQEFNLVNELSVAENVFLGHSPLRHGLFIDRKIMNEKAKELFKTLDIEINPDMLVSQLTVGYQQMVEIAKALSMNAKIIVMDEPSAPLTNVEVEHLFKVIHTLKEQEVTVIYISHRLDEIFAISDRVSVMRDGQLITTMDTKDIVDEKELIKLMVGREFNEKFPPKPDCIKNEVALEVKNLSGNGVENISFEVHNGEILGFGGLIGAGRTETAELLFGAKQKTGGRVILNGKEINCKSTGEAIKEGIAYVPEDRKRQGILADISIRENITMAILTRIASLSLVNKKAERTIVDKYYRELKIKTPTLEQLVKHLSGGNQQKVVVAKWLASEPTLIILDEPTRGIDVGAKYEIYKLINQLVEMGKAVIMISSEMEELIGMSDRIVVLCEGHKTGMLERREFSQEKILELASMSKQTN